MTKEHSNPECTIHDADFGMIDIGNHGISNYVCEECIDAMKEVTRLARIVTTDANSQVIEWLNRLRTACENVGEAEIETLKQRDKE